MYKRQVVTVTRRNEGESSQAFSVADAKKAGLWGKQGPWTNYPDRMLLFRARGFILRDVFGDVLKGFKTTEELADIPRDITGQVDVAPSSYTGTAKPAPSMAAQPTAEGVQAQPAAEARKRGRPAAVKTHDAQTADAPAPARAPADTDTVPQMAPIPPTNHAVQNSFLD